MQRGLCASVRGAEAARGRAGAGGFRSCGGGRGSGSAGAVISGSGIFRKAAFLHGSVVRGILAAFEDRSDCASGADRRCILPGCRTGGTQGRWSSCAGRCCAFARRCRWQRCCSSFCRSWEAADEKACTGAQCAAALDYARSGARAGGSGNAGLRRAGAGAGARRTNAGGAGRCVGSIGRRFRHAALEHRNRCAVKRQSGAAVGTFLGRKGSGSGNPVRLCFRCAGRPRRKAACSDCGGVCHHGALHARRTVDDCTGARDDYEKFRTLRRCCFRCSRRALPLPAGA